MKIIGISNYKVLISVLFFAVIINTQCQSQKGDLPKINGVSFVASKDTIRQKHIEPVLKVNANWASIMPFAFMKSLDTTKIYYNNDNQWYGEREDGVVQSIKMMHKNKIKVMLKPQIWIGNGDFTGNIIFKSNEDWQNFEQQYAEMILFYAKVAQDSKAEMFCLGTELNSFVNNRPAFWSDLITEVKKVYQGKLTYAENWDKIDNVSFWNQLDYIGVDAYFPISEQKTPELEQVKLRWKEISLNLKNLSQNHSKPILFTEFGYRSIDFAGKSPWDSTRIEGQVNEDAQDILLTGLIESVWNKPWFAGGFLWKWFHDPEQLSDWQANRFCVHGKLAERTLKMYFEKYN